MTVPTPAAAIGVPSGSGKSTPVWVQPFRGAPNGDPIGPGTGRRKRTGPEGAEPEPALLPPPGSARSVSGPAIPSTLIPAASCARLTAASVSGPKRPSALPGP